MPPCRWRIAGIWQMIEIAMMDFITMEIRHIANVFAEKTALGKSA